MNKHSNPVESKGFLDNNVKKDYTLPIPWWTFCATQFLPMLE